MTLISSKKRVYPAADRLARNVRIRHQEDLLVRYEIKKGNSLTTKEASWDVRPV